MAERYDVAIIGGGLAGLTAGMYAARQGLRTVILERMMAGGQVFNVEKMETYPGFPDGIGGAELGPNVQDQATKAGAEFKMAEVDSLTLKDPYRSLQTSEGEIIAKAVIVAAGSTLRKLGVPGEEEFWGRGISQCASCDGNFFQDQVVAVIGGGDSALEEAMVLTEYASKVLIIVRGKQFRGVKAAQDLALSHPKIEVRYNTVVEEILGEDNVTALKLKDATTGKEHQESVSGVFTFVGLEPNTKFLSGVLPLDGAGHIPVSISMETEVPGIFAAGDLREHSARQLVTAAGDGATAALAAGRYIASRSW